MKIGFIGCGNMGGALAKAICTVSNTLVYISDKNREKLEVFARTMDVALSTNSDIAKSCDIIFLGVKPNIIGAVCEEISDALSERNDALIVSMAAGVTLEALEGYLGKKAIVRIMPNTPVAQGMGMITWCKNANVTKSQRDAFLYAMQKCGVLDELPEALIDAASAVAGCGPAFVYMFAESLADGGVECGLPRDKANKFAAETLKGAAEMLLRSDKHPGALKDEVCSPGGSTIEGVHALESGAFRSVVADAVVAAFEKTKKLGK